MFQLSRLQAAGPVAINLFDASMFGSLIACLSLLRFSSWPRSLLAPPPVDNGRPFGGIESLRLSEVSDIVDDIDHLAEDRYRGWVGFLVAVTLHVTVLLMLALMIKPGLVAKPVLTVVSLDDAESYAAMVRLGDEAPVEAPLALDGTESAAVVSLSILDEIHEAEIVPPDWAVSWNVAVDRSIDGAPMNDNEKPASDVQFFGTHAYGNKFVYVLDVSGSMAKGGGGRIQRARAELIRSVNSLQPHHSFYVVLYSNYAVGMFGEWKTARLQPATPENKVKVARWISQIQPAGGTLPAAALKIAGDLVPDAVFFLSDGEFVYESTDNIAMEQFLRSFRSARSRKIPTPKHSPKQVLDAFAPEIAVHTIAFESLASRVTMERIAREKGGEFRFVAGPQAEEAPRRRVAGR